MWLGALVMILGYATFEYGSASKDLIANNVISHQSMILSVYFCSRNRSRSCSG